MRGPLGRRTLAALAAVSSLAVACSSAGEPTRPPTTHVATPGNGASATRTTATRIPAGDRLRPVVTGIVADHLDTPWGIAFLPDGTALVTQRDHGTIVAVRGHGVAYAGTVPGTAPTSEGGLLGIAVSPNYSTDHTVYCYQSTSSENRVVAMRYDGSRISGVHPVLGGIPVGDIHDGGRLAFGPDGYLYVSTGESGEGRLAQDPESLGGKILRITPTGEPAPGNPDPGSPVWTTGHRNVEGLAWDARGRMWASEFGLDTWDELNRIRRGHDYGWPLAEGRAHLPGHTDPVVQWHVGEASPSGLAYLDGSLWMAALRGARLWRIPVRPDGGVGTPRSYFVGRYGRLRTVVAAPGGSLWLTTSNRDGRGFPKPGDDKILRVVLRR